MTDLATIPDVVEAHLCIACPMLRPGEKPRRPNTMPVCDGCRTRTRDDLGGIPADYATLPAGLEPGRGGQERGGLGFGSRLPAALGPLDLLGPGSMVLTEVAWTYPSDQLGSPPPLVLLHWWSLDWVTVRDMRETPPVPVMDDLVGWLLNRLDWAMDNHHAVDEFAADVSHMARTVRAVSQAGTKGEPAGRCPRQQPDRAQRCGAKLTVDPYVDRITCPRCGASWDQKTGGWLRLRGAQLEMEETA